jgi:hypothetical protein
MIDKIYQPTSGNDKIDMGALRKVIDNIHDQAAGFVYSSTIPTDVPHGKILIYDNGAGTKRMYVKTGEGNLGWVGLT